MSDRQGEMARDAALAITEGADRYRRLHDGQQWEAIREAAGVLSCYAYGHPDQPRPRRKWAQRPWRCRRCETWWVTERTPYTEGSWHWTRVYPDERAPHD